MAEAVLQVMDTYVSCRKHSCTIYFNQAHDRPVSGDERRSGSRVAMRWWDQYGLDLKGMHTADQEAKCMEVEEEMEGAGVDMD